MGANTHAQSESELCEILGARFAKVLMMRRENKTLSEIGAHIGVSKERVRQIIAKSERIIRRKSGGGIRNLSDFSTRARNCFINAGYSKEEQIINDIKTGKITPASMPGYGLKTHLEVCEHLKIAVNNFEKIKPISDKTIRRYIRALKNNGYKVERKK